MGCVDAREIFTSVNYGRPGSHTHSETVSCNKTETMICLSAVLCKVIEGVSIRPCSISLSSTIIKSHDDAAFPLSSTIIKCYDDDNHVDRKKSFNYCYSNNESAGTGFLDTRADGKRQHISTSIIRSSQAKYIATASRLCSSQ